MVDRDIHLTPALLVEDNPLADRAAALVRRSGPAACKCAGPQREFLPQHSQPPPSSLPGL